MQRRLRSRSLCKRNFFLPIEARRRRRRRCFRFVEGSVVRSEPGLEAPPRNPKTVHSEKFKTRTLKTQGCGTRLRALAGLGEVAGPKPVRRRGVLGIIRV